MKKKNSERLESIKAAHEVEKTRSSSRMEDYLEIISELVELKGYATTLDISRYMNVSAPSVTKMLQRLDEGGFLEYEKYHGINLTKKGIQIAEGIRQNHGILLEFFGWSGVGFGAIPLMILMVVIYFFVLILKLGDGSISNKIKT